MRYCKWFGASVSAIVMLIGFSIGGRLLYYKRIYNSPSIAIWRGHRDAERDLSHGVYEQIDYGLPMAWVENYRKAMMVRYHVNVVLGGCVTVSGMRDYASAYNKTARDGVIRHFGHDVFAETAREAELDSVRNQLGVLSFAKARP